MFRLALLLTLVLSQAAYADFVEYDDRDDWFAAADLTTTIGFWELGGSFFIMDEYAALGIHFLDGTDGTIGPGCETYINDCWGLWGGSPGPNVGISVSFDAPIFAIAADHPGTLRMDLYYEGELVYTSGNFGSGGVGFFGGILSTTPFDGAVLYRTTGTNPQVFIDDLHFTTIPAPSTLALLGLGALGAGCRRRRDRT